MPFRPPRSRLSRVRVIDSRARCKSCDGPISATFSLNLRLIYQIENLSRP